MSSSEHTMGETTAEELLPDFGQHNMIAFGRDIVFLSHLPMFMAPHDAQLILEVTLGAAGGGLQEIWSKERASHPDERLYTMMPERFPLSTLYDEDPPRRGSFRGRFFRCHLERGGVVVPGLSNRRGFRRLGAADACRGASSRQGRAAQSADGYRRPVRLGASPTDAGRVGRGARS